LDLRQIDFEHKGAPTPKRPRMCDIKAISIGSIAHLRTEVFVLYWGGVFPGIFVSLSVRCISCIHDCTSNFY